MQRIAMPARTMAEVLSTWRPHIDLELECAHELWLRCGGSDDCVDAYVIADGRPRQLHGDPECTQLGLENVVKVHCRPVDSVLFGLCWCWPSGSEMSKEWSFTCYSLLPAAARLGASVGYVESIVNARRAQLLLESMTGVTSITRSKVRLPHEHVLMEYTREHIETCLERCRKALSEGRAGAEVLDAMGIEQLTGEFAAVAFNRNQSREGKSGPMMHRWERETTGPSWWIAAAGVWGPGLDALLYGSDLVVMVADRAVCDAMGTEAEYHGFRGPVPVVGPVSVSELELTGRLCEDLSLDDALMAAHAALS